MIPLHVDCLLGQNGMQELMLTGTMFSGRRQQSFKQFQFSKNYFVFMQLGDARAQQGFVKAVIKTSLTTNPLKLQSLASTKKYLPCYYFHHHHDHSTTSSLLCMRFWREVICKGDSSRPRGSGTDVGNLLGGASVSWPLLRKYPQ